MSTPLETKLAEIKKLCEAAKSGPTDDFWQACLDEAEMRFKGHFVRIDKQAFILGCSYGYGASKSDLGVSNLLPKLVQALELAIEQRNSRIVTDEQWEAGETRTNQDAELLTILTGSKPEGD